MLKPAWKDLMPAVDELGAGNQVSRYQLQASWAEFVGPQLAQHSQPQKMQGRSLLVLTRGSIWSQEIMLLQGTLVPAIRKRFPRLPIEAIRCRVGTLRGDSGPAPERATPDLTQIELPATVTHRLEQLAAEIADPGLRESFLRAVIQQEKRKTWLRQGGAIECLNCGQLQDFRLCRGCLQEDRRQRREALFKILGRRPWSTYEEAASQIRPLSQGDFHQARRHLLSNLFRDFWEQRALLKEGEPLPSGLRHVLLDICMLSTATPWDQLQDRHVLYSLGKIWGRAYLDDRAPPPRPKTMFSKQQGREVRGPRKELD